MLFITTTSTTAYAFVLPFAKYMREKGHDISFACSLKSFADAPSRVQEIRDAGFVVHDIPLVREINAFQDINAFWSLTRLLRDTNYDLVHTYTSKAGFLGRFAAKLAGCPLVIHTILGLFYQTYNSGFKRNVFILMEKLAAPFCDAMLCISEGMRQEAIHHHLKDEAELEVVGLGIDFAQLRNLKTDVAAVRAQYGLIPTDLVIGSVGRLVYQKGFDTLLRAAALVLQRYPDACLVIAGSGELQAELEALASSLGIAEKVKFLGHINNAEVLRLMSTLDLFVLSTRFEGLGVVYLEAMALECPTVGSRISPVTEVVKDGETGLLATVDDPEDLARAILVLLEDAELRKRMGRAGVLHVEREFDEKQVFKRIEAVYEKKARAVGIF
jgi:glycosyltransferase involved in cell wall biosynthesis